MSNDFAVFRCEKCGKTTEHARLNHQHAGELWRCTSCGWKTMHDESKSWAKVTPDYQGTKHEERFNQDMKDAKVRATVDFIALWFCGPWGFQNFTAAKTSRIAHVFVTHWAGL